MMQQQGYVILQKPAKALTNHDAWVFAQMNPGYLEELRKTFAFIDPSRYRGMSRKALEPYPDDPWTARQQAKWGVDMHTNKRARIRFRQRLGKTYSADNYDSDLLPTLADAHVVFSCLDAPQDYEIMALSRKVTGVAPTTLGFDIGYWGGDRFSLICDTVVMPTWHPPDPEDFTELSNQLKNINEYILFKTRAEAQAFRAYYFQKPWAETDTPPGQFNIIQVSTPR